MTWQLSPNVLMTIAGAMISIALVVVIWKYRHRIRAMISKAKAGSAPANIIPLARDMVVENMSDAVIMLDQQNRIMDLNIAARSIIDQDGSQPIGQYMDKVWAAWPVDMTLPLGKVEIVKEVSIKSSTGYQYYDLRISPLNDQQGLLAGRLVVLRDITRQKRAEETLRRRDETLEAIGFAAEQFLKKVAWEESIQEVLARLGEATRVSRIYLFENEGGLAGKPLTSYRYEWVTWGLASQLKDESLQNIDLMERGLSRWVEVLGRGQTINECVRDLPEGEKVLLESRGVHSVAIVPIFLDKTWW